MIINTVAKGASQDEFELFIAIAGKYDLDPFAKEIWCVKYQSSPAAIFVSRDGFLKIANRQPAFDGIKSDAIYEGDTLERTDDGYRMTYGPRTGSPTGAIATVYRKDRRMPVTVYASFAEYSAGNNPTWKKFPTAMIVKVAEAQALKKAFSISGVSAEGERAAMDVAYDEVREPAVTQAMRDELMSLMHTAVTDADGVVQAVFTEEAIAKTEAMLARQDLPLATYEKVLGMAKTKVAEATQAAIDSHPF